jgi:hypothetical protein
MPSQTVGRWHTRLLAEPPSRSPNRTPPEGRARSVGELLPKARAVIRCPGEHVSRWQGSLVCWDDGDVGLLALAQHLHRRLT